MEDKRLESVGRLLDVLDELREKCRTALKTKALALAIKYSLLTTTTINITLFPKRAHLTALKLR